MIIINCIIVINIFEIGDKMEYNIIPLLLKRYSFEEKMNICQYISKDYIYPDGQIDIEKLRKGILPWELETFALFSIMSNKEYSHEDFKSKDDKRFLEIMACIRNYVHPKLNEGERNRFVDRFLIVTGINQFSFQEYYIYRLFRYNYFFNFSNSQIDMKRIFFDKFGCSYDEFKKLTFMLNMFFSNNIIERKILDYIIMFKYSNAYKQLKINRDEFIIRQNEISNSIDDYLYCFKLFFQYPFIYYKDTSFLPLPHILIQSTTSALLYRITEKNDALREKIGKEVIENYLVYILKESGLYNEVIPEQVYKKSGKERRTIDCMVRKDNRCILLDSKSIVPFVKTREMDEYFIDITIDRIANSIIQVFDHITERFQYEYYPFSEHLDFDKNNIYGIVVILEDSYIRRNRIIDCVAKKKGIDINSNEYNYICSNIKVLGLYDIENKTFNNENLVTLLEINRDDKKKWFDFSLSAINSEVKPSRMINEFIENEKNDLSKFTQELVDIGLIKKE